jgi:hypothetical protein
MSVLYRALWCDESQADTQAYLDEVRVRFGVWAALQEEPELLSDGEHDVVLPGSRRRSISLRSKATAPVRVPDTDDDVLVDGFEGVTRDVSPGASGTTWTTVLRAVSDGSAVHVWVENRVESDDLTLRPQVGRPRLVDDLLAMRGKACLGGSSVSVETVDFPSAGVGVLTDYLASESRTLPVIVCTEPTRNPNPRWAEAAERIARRAGGIAKVVRLDADATVAFRQALGSLSTWEGGIRVYAPTPVGEPSEGRLHRYFLGQLIASREDAMVDRVVSQVAHMSTRRRTHPLFSVFTATAVASEQADESVDLSGYVSEAEAEAQRLEYEADIESAQSEHDALQREYNQALGHLDRLKRALEEGSLAGLFWETRHDAGNDVPDEVQDTDDAILTAQAYLSEWLVIHSEAGQELDGINTGPQSFAWGNTAWRGFRALAAYAEARSTGFQGNFYDWCKSGPPLGWPATSKKLSMTESATVRTSGLIAARSLPVDVEVDPSGKVTMLAHLKVAEGGGNLAPRIYFHDDTGGSTKKVHVGFVGPHYLMPNTKS